MNNRETTCPHCNEMVDVYFLICPYCETPRTYLTDTKLIKEKSTCSRPTNNRVRRRIKCPKCKKKYSVSSNQVRI